MDYEVSEQLQFKGARIVELETAYQNWVNLHLGCFHPIVTRRAWYDLNVYSAHKGSMHNPFEE